MNIKKNRTIGIRTDDHFLKLLESASVIPPFLMGLSRRIHAAVFSFMAGVIPPLAMLGRSLLYVQGHFVA